MSAAAKALLYTLLAIAGYWLGARIPNPFVTAEAMGFLYADVPLWADTRASFGPFVLGIGPALSGFFLVEAASFFLPPLSRWRRGGFPGRAKLNRASLVLSFLLAAATAAFIVRQMSEIRSGQLNFLDGSNAALFGAGAFYVGGFAIVYLAACAMNELGLGHGFGLFLFTGAVRRLGEGAWRTYMSGGAGEEAGPVAPLWTLLLSLLLLGVFLYWVSRRRVVEAEHGGRALLLEVPPILEGLFAWSVAWQLTALMRTLDLLLQFKLNLTLDHSSAFVRYSLFLFFFSGACAFLYYVAFSPRRFRSNTFGRVALSSEEGRKIGRLAVAAFAGVALFELVGHLPHPLAAGETILSRAFDLGSVVSAFVLGKDIWQNWVFLRRVPSPVFLGELDNIHLAALLRAEAEAAGQPVYLKGFEYRRLMSFFQPLQKVRVYASAEYADTLRERIGLNSYPVI